jgi:hypothetical protein
MITEASSVRSAEAAGGTATPDDATTVAVSATSHLNNRTAG